MEQVDVGTARGRVRGRVDPAFREVLDTFVENFDAHGEVGASVCLSVEGETRVDLWGGHVDEAGSAPWTEDTLSLVFSVTKAATALCAHLLIERGELDLHAKVTRYWPEFGQQGKEDATVAMMLNHSVGLPAFRDPIKPGGYYDWDYMVGRLEQEEPFWKPGIRNGYHMISFGWTVGELVRRVSGKSLGTFFADEFARPLGLDFWIGLPEALEPRVSHMIPFLPGPEGPFTDFTKALIGDPTSIPALSWLNSGGYSPDAREAHAAEIGGGGGISNARSLVRLFEPLADGGGALFSRDSVTRMSQVSMATGDDATLCMPTRFALGFMKSMDNRHRPFGDIESCILGDRAFGHVGAGGSLGFADPDCALAFGYTMNRMGAGLLLNVRGQGLVDAAYRAVGFRTDAPGVWVP
ncbi:MAG: serine hydrolase domain-containing protein [Pseudomonadales bacterium]|jgi:CubicO group peptidase (beta-lactamase class C family)|nr:serine hydrolase domain-containing protein [Pseudomonadales bacterium]